MADSPISGLPSAGALTGTELFAVDQSGTTDKVTLDEVTSFINDNGLWTLDTGILSPTDPTNTIGVTKDIQFLDVVNRDTTTYQIGVEFGEHSLFLQAKDAIVDLDGGNITMYSGQGYNGPVNGTASGNIVLTINDAGDAGSGTAGSGGYFLAQAGHGGTGNATADGGEGGSVGILGGTGGEGAASGVIIELDPTPNDGGTGYLVGDIVTIDGGNDDATFSVDSVDGGGVITAITLVDGGTGYHKTSYPTTGGTGTGANIKVNHAETSKPGAGGSANVVAGTGGSGTTTSEGGNGGDAFLRGGAPGVDGGLGEGFHGNATIEGGLLTFTSFTPQDVNGMLFQTAVGVNGLGQNGSGITVTIGKGGDALTDQAAAGEGGAYNITTGMGGSASDQINAAKGGDFFLQVGSGGVAGISNGHIAAMNETPTDQGSGYTLNDILTITTGDGTATVEVIDIGGGGEVLEISYSGNGGTGYSVGPGQATSGGTGTGCTVEVTLIARPRAGTGGQLSLNAGNGGDGSTDQPSGNGGLVYIQAGSPGAPAGGGYGSWGEVQIVGGVIHSIARETGMAAFLFEGSQGPVGSQQDGSGMSINLGTGSVADGVGEAGASGGLFFLQTGNGGDGLDTDPPGHGGDTQFYTGLGGNGTATQPGGNGGEFFVTTGGGGADGGASAGRAGNITLTSDITILRVTYSGIQAIIPDDWTQAFIIQQESNNYFVIDTSNSAEIITLGSFGIHPTITNVAKDWNVFGTETATIQTYDIILQATGVDANVIQLTTGSGVTGMHQAGGTILMQTGSGSDASGTGTAGYYGGFIQTNGGHGGNGNGTDAAGIGGNLIYAGGKGGTGTADVPGADGGTVTYHGGVGGDGTAAQQSGSGGNIVFSGGDPGTDNGGGSGNEGKIVMTSVIDLENIAAGDDNFIINPTSATPSTTWTAGVPSNDPDGFIQINNGSGTRFIPYWT